MLIGSSLDEPLEEIVLEKELVEEEVLDETMLEVEFEEELFVAEEFVRLFEEDEGCVEDGIELLGVTITNWQPVSQIITKGAIKIFFI